MQSEGGQSKRQDGRRTNCQGKLKPQKSSDGCGLPANHGGSEAGAAAEAVTCAHRYLKVSPASISAAGREAGRAGDSSQGRDGLRRTGFANACARQVIESDVSERRGGEEG